MCYVWMTRKCCSSIPERSRDAVTDPKSKHTNPSHPTKPTPRRRPLVPHLHLLPPPPHIRARPPLPPLQQVLLLHHLLQRPHRNNNHRPPNLRRQRRLLPPEPHLHTPRRPSLPLDLDARARGVGSAVRNLYAEFRVPFAEIYWLCGYLRERGAEYVARFTTSRQGQTWLQLSHINVSE